MSQYNTTSQMPSHGAASRNQVGNSREGFQRPSMPSGGMPNGGQVRGAVQQAVCSFAAPPPGRNYCHPAQFSAVNGARYFTLSSAYGASVPATSNY